MKITLSEIHSYVILIRNIENSIFYIRPKSDLVKEMENGTPIISFQNEGYFSETQIINMINIGIKFYTLNKLVFTTVIAVNGHIKSTANGSVEDNISQLPLFVQTPSELKG